MDGTVLYAKCWICNDWTQHEQDENGAWACCECGTVGYKDV